MTKSQSNKRNIIILALIILIIAAITLIQHQLSKTKFNDSFVNGNQAGNLYNAGLFCESDDLIFFSNPKDQHKLYSMTTDGNNLTKLSDDTVSYINADEHYIYYVRDNNNNGTAFSFLKWSSNSLCRISRSGGKVTILDNDPCLYASLVGNYIYYIHYDKESASTLYKIKIDGTEKQQVNINPYFTCCTNGSYLYYNGLDGDHNIYRFDTQTGSETLLYEGNCWQPVVIGEIAYFLAAENNYALTKADLSTGETTTLSTDRVDCFNVFGSYIYYQRSDTNHPALCRITTDGDNLEEIMAGIYTSINIAGDYVYFYTFHDDTTCYRLPFAGNAEISEFVPTE